MMKNTEAPGSIFPGIEDITRRDFLVGGAAALLLSGCGSSGSDETSGETRTVEHPLGTTEVPVRPERVVTLDNLSVFDPLLQLGVAPVGTVSDVNVLGDMGEVEKVGSSSEPNLEAIAALEPDLILGHFDFNPTESYERLSEIAPTVFIENFREDDDALGRQRKLAEVFGLTDRFEELLGEYDTRVGEVKSRLGEMLDSLEVSLLNPYAESDTIYVYRGDNLGGVRVLSDLGVSLSKGVGELPDDGTPFPFVSFELIPELDADVIFALFDPRSGGQEREDFNSAPLLTRTFAYEEDQIFAVNSDAWYGGGSILALNLVLDDIERYLLEREIDTSGNFR